jgi:hypothetical protein
VDPDGTVRLIGAILAGVPVAAAGPACRHQDPRGCSTTGSTVIPASSTTSGTRLRRSLLAVSESLD